MGVSETLRSCVCQAGGLSGCGHLASVPWGEATANSVSEHRPDSLASALCARSRGGLRQPRRPLWLLPAAGAPTPLGPRPLPRRHIRPLTFPFTPALPDSFLLFRLCSPPSREDLVTTRGARHNPASPPSQGPPLSHVCRRLWGSGRGLGEHSGGSRVRRGSSQALEVHWVAPAAAAAFGHVGGEDAVGGDGGCAGSHRAGGWEPRGQGERAAVALGGCTRECWPPPRLSLFPEGASGSHRPREVGTWPGSF